MFHVSPRLIFRTTTNRGPKRVGASHFNFEGRHSVWNSLPTSCHFAVLRHNTSMILYEIDPGCPPPRVCTHRFLVVLSVLCCHERTCLSTDVLDDTSSASLVSLWNDVTIWRARLRDFTGGGTCARLDEGTYSYS